MAWIQEKRNEFLEFMARLYAASPVGRMVRRIIIVLAKGRYEYATAFDDLRAPATTINLSGQPADPAKDDDGSLLFSGTIENNIAIIMQLPHSWKIGSSVMPHIHWCKSVAGAGGVDWQMRYRIVKNGGETTAWSAYASAEPVYTVTNEINNNISRFPSILLTGVGLSDLLSFQIRRNPSAVTDTYGNNARMWEFDVHYEMDSIGSFYEFKKDE